MIGQKPVITYAAFTILKPTGHNFSYIFYDTEDIIDVIGCGRRPRYGLFIVSIRRVPFNSFICFFWVLIIESRSPILISSSDLLKLVISS